MKSITKFLCKANDMWHKLTKWISKNWRDLLLPIVTTLVAIILGFMIGTFIGAVMAFNALLGV